MRGAWKIAALLAGAAAMGLSGCAKDAGDSPEATTSLEGPGETAEAIHAHPPLCPRGSTLMPGSAGGYICREGDLFPTPYCPVLWMLVPRGSGYMCLLPRYPVETPWHIP